MSNSKLFKKKKINCKEDENSCAFVNSILYDHFQIQFDKLVNKIKMESIKVIEVYVIKGDQKDSDVLSFPTANTEIKYENVKRINNGFILSNTKINGIIYHSVSLVNKRNHLIKTYIFDFDKNIYGEKIQITFFNPLITISTNELADNNKIKELFKLSIEKAEKIINNNKKLF